MVLMCALETDVHRLQNHITKLGYFWSTEYNQYNQENLYYVKEMHCKLNILPAGSRMPVVSDDWLARGT